MLQGPFSIIIQEAKLVIFLPFCIELAVNFYFINTVITSTDHIRQVNQPNEIGGIEGFLSNQTL